MNQILRSRSFLFVLLFVCIVSPSKVGADASAFVFVTSPQSVAPGSISEVLILQTQDAGGNASIIPQTGCIALTSDSSSGQFSSSATSWNQVGVLTMNTGSSKRSFYYTDVAAGSHIITAKFALKPASVSASCASWPVSEWGSVLSATQTIIVGATAAASASTPANNAGSFSSTTTFTQQVPTSTGNNSNVETLEADIRTEPTGTVGAGQFFAGAASNAEGNTMAHVRYLWNFGDGATDEGQTVFHTYVYPGTYVVGLVVASGNEEGSARATITVLPIQLGFIAEPDGSVVLSNQSSKEINIGLWSITSGTTTFVLPQDTIILGGQDLHVPSNTLHMVAVSNADVRYPNGTPVLVTRISQPTTTSSVQSAPDTPQYYGAPIVPIKSRTATTKKNTKISITDIAPTSTVSAVSDSGASLPMWSWVVGGLGVALIVFGAVSYTGLPFKRKTIETTSSSDEFEIE